MAEPKISQKISRFNIYLLKAILILYAGKIEDNAYPDFPVKKTKEGHGCTRLESRLGALRIEM